MQDFGVKRVLEPKGAIPVTAWKIDNSRSIGETEIRVRLQTIHVEWDNFDQICSYCSYDVSGIKARIMQVIEERGKLHNPYTGSGGLFLGVIDEIGSLAGRNDLKVGDRVIGLSSLTGLPMSIDSIGEIDFYYGQMECSGYVICFQATSMVKFDGSVNPKYLLSAIDEEGTFLGIQQAVRQRQAKKIAIIGGSLVKTLLYGQILTDCYGKGTTVIAVMDKNSPGHLTEEEVTASFRPVIRRTYYVDLSLPMEAYEHVLAAGRASKEAGIAARTAARTAAAETAGNGAPDNGASNNETADNGTPIGPDGSIDGSDGSLDGPVDAVINLEDILGSETLATLLVKEEGVVFYTSLKNNYSVGILVADSMGKEVIPYALDGYGKDVYRFAVELVRNVSPHLDALDRTLRMREKQRGGSRMGKLPRLDRDIIGRIDDFVFQSPVTRALIDESLNVAQYDCNVIIQGETGVGKEKIFNIIHQNSHRHGKPCVKINCATIQENLAESEFFGYEKGSFTGAQAGGKAGYFEMANNGTLFLDEIGSLSLNMQSKLLRVLQENTYYRVGGTELKYVNVRVICANNVPLKKLVDQGTFRSDLFYRLNICSIDVPPLRERREDIACLAEAFLKKYSKKYGVDKELSPEAVKRLEAYHWPGNVRELENTVHRLYINERNRIISQDAVDDLLNESVYEEMILNVRKAFSQESQLDFNQIMEEQEKRIIAYALKKEGTTRKAAQLLGIPQATLARKKVRYGL